MARPKISFSLDPSEWATVFNAYVKETRMDARAAFKKKAVAISFGLFRGHRDLRGKILRAIEAVAKPGNAIRIRSRIKTAQAVRLSKKEAALKQKVLRLRAMKNQDSKAAGRTRSSIAKFRQSVKELRGESLVTDFLGRQTTDERKRELCARRASAGFIAARSWKLGGQTLDDLAPIDKRSKIRKRTDPDNLALELENTRPNMGDFVRKTKYTQTVMDAEVQDMKEGILKVINRRLNKANK